MTLDDFSKKLNELASGQYAQLDHDTYAILFPPGEPDERAREACYKFAKDRGLRIENKPEHRVIWFVRD
ncbi:hypothetical protein [Pseudorhodoplanes sp.]|uniref:hypothetical protein n=1 Tax=Pseudorhodoplanes sp. TaxID=1934341 RepID=UPI002B93B4EB|nr:hypothetical protein [Pseudorhodoplanes sp.]HWV41312.1 hypothetical protein [Pseudorhodoplanes sp.]